MFDMGFEPQITKIISNIQPDRQTVLFSATFPRTVESAARKILKNPVEITVRGQGVVADTIDQKACVRLPSASSFLFSFNSGQPSPFPHAEIFAFPLFRQSHAHTWFLGHCR
jgi:hypothetical protein